TCWPTRRRVKALASWLLLMTACRVLADRPAFWKRIDRVSPASIVMVVHSGRTGWAARGAGGRLRPALTTSGEAAVERVSWILVSSIGDDKVDRKRARQN